MTTIQPTDKEINEVIARFMKWNKVPKGNCFIDYMAMDFEGEFHKMNFTENLDACIPVIEKITREKRLLFDLNNNIANSWWVHVKKWEPKKNIWEVIPEFSSGNSGVIEWLETPSQALSIALYETIKAK